MITKILYKYHRKSGGVDVSPIKPETEEYTIMYRLIADDGKIFVDAEGNKFYCIDTDYPEQYTEIEGGEE